MWTCLPVRSVSVAPPLPVRLCAVLRGCVAYSLLARGQSVSLYLSLCASLGHNAHKHTHLCPSSTKSKSIFSSRSYQAHHSTTISPPIPRAVRCLCFIPLSQSWSAMHCVIRSINDHYCCNPIPDQVPAPHAARWLHLVAALL